MYCGRIHHLRRRTGDKEQSDWTGKQQINGLLRSISLKFSVPGHRSCTGTTLDSRHLYKAAIIYSPTGLEYCALLSVQPCLNCCRTQDSLEGVLLPIYKYWMTKALCLQFQPVSHSIKRTRVGDKVWANLEIKCKAIHTINLPIFKYDFTHMQSS